MKNKRYLILVLILARVFTIQFAHSQQKIFWTDPSETAPAIHCVDASGVSCKDSTSANNTVLLSLSANDNPVGLAVDEKNEKLIWVNYGSTGKIERCNFDGTGRESILSSLVFPEHLAIDYANQKLYWTSSSGIFKSNLDGTSPELLSAISAVNFTGIAVDSTNSILFWSDSFSNTTIYKTDLTNISQTNVVNLDVSETIFGLALNPATTSLYWTVQNSSQSALEYTSSYNSGTTINTLISSLPGSNYQGWQGIALDYPESNVYFANSSDRKIYKSSLTPASAAANLFLNTSGEIGALAISCGRYATDTDSDGTKDCAESCDSDPLKVTAGICGCGTADTDSDSDGTPDCNDGCDNDLSKTAPGLCGCGLPDIDSDQDGVLNCNDACPADGEKTGAGTCGCGVEDADTDNDGTFDCDDECPEDFRKIAAGTCGCGMIEDINSDGKEVCAQNRQLTPNTKIENPPIVEVVDDPDSDTAEVTITLEKFVKPTLTLKKKKKGKSGTASMYSFSAFASDPGLKVTYEIQLTKTDSVKKNVKKLTSKRNQLTIKNLTAGNYEIKYRAVITDDGDAAAKTKFSPGASFTVQ